MTSTTGYDGRPGLVDRLGLASGAAWVVLILVGNGMTESGVPTEDSPVAAQQYFELLRNGSHRLGIALEMLGMCLMLVFLARAYAVLRDAEGRGGWLAGLALTGGLTTMAVKIGSIAPYLVGLAVRDLSGEQALLMQRLGDGAFLVTCMTSGLLVLGIAGSALRSGILPRWLAWLGFPIGALAVFGSLAVDDLDGSPGVPGFLLGLLWIAAISVLLAVRGHAVVEVTGREAVLAPA